MLLALPVFAQDERNSAVPLLPSNPAALAGMRDNITLELQRIQDMLRLFGQNDPQLVETLTTRQKELTEQLSDILRQSQDVGRPSVAPGIVNPAARTNGVDPITGQPVLPPTQRQVDPLNPGVQPGLPGMMGGGSIQPTYPAVPIYTPPSYTPPSWPTPPNWMDSQQQTYQLPKELTEVKQSVEALQKEVASLKATIKDLETHILLLSRVISQNDKGRENGN